MPFKKTDSLSLSLESIHKTATYSAGSFNRFVTIAVMVTSTSGWGSDRLICRSSNWKITNGGSALPVIDQMEKWLTTRD